jgi:hypothetical protein
LFCVGPSEWDKSNTINAALEAEARLARYISAPRSRREEAMKKATKTAAELEASIKVEMEDICDAPTHMSFSVQPDGDSWKIRVLQEENVDDAERRDTIERIAARLRAEYDLKS